MTLADLKKGDRAEVLALKAKGEIRRRLLDMGIVKGTAFQILRKAPLGDPIEILVKNFNLSLRREEANYILVKKV